MRPSGCWCGGGGGGGGGGPRGGFGCGRRPRPLPAAPLEQTVLTTLAAGSAHGLGRGERCEASVAAEGREACAARDLPLQRGVGRLVRAWYKHGVCKMVSMARARWYKHGICIARGVWLGRDRS